MQNRSRLSFSCAFVGQWKEVIQVKNSLVNTKFSESENHDVLTTPTL